MSIMNEFLDTNEDINTLEDQSVVKEGGDFEYTPPPAGKSVARLISYVELGKRGQRPYQGKPKPDCEEIRVVFELLSPKYIQDIEIDGETKKVPHIISIKMAKKLGDKAKFTKLFSQLRYGRDGIKHMAQMLGDGYIVTVFHATAEKDGKTRTYANLNDENGVYHITAPRIEDPISNEVTHVKVPEATRPLQMFLWDRPNKKMWDSLFIDGSRTVKDDKGVETEVSNNWLQALVMEAKNFKGSALETMLEGVADLPGGGIELDAPPLAQDGPGQAKQDLPAASTPKTTNAADDALAAMGLG